MLKFTVPGKVQAKQSTKFSNHGGFVRTYTPKEMVNYANLVKINFQYAYPDHLPSVFIDKPLKMQITVNIEVPKSYSNKKTNKCLTGEIRPTVKPDCDNIAKNIQDSLNGIAYPDDKQIVVLAVRKYYSQNPSVQIEIDEVN